MMRRSRQRRRKIKNILAVAGAALVLIVGALLFFRIAHGTPVSVLPSIQQNGVLRIGVTSDVAPFGSLDETGNLEGFEAELAVSLGSQIVPEQGVMLVPVSNRTRGAYLSNGSVDVLVAMVPASKTNLENFAMSDVYYTEPYVFLARSGITIDNYAALAGKTIGVFYNSAAHSTLESLISEQKNATAPAVEGYTSYEEISQALASGEIDAIFCERSLLAPIQVEGAAIAPYTPASVSYAVTSRKQETDLAQALFDAMTTLQEDGTLSQLYQKYGLTPPAED